MTSDPNKTSYDSLRDASNEFSKLFGVDEFTGSKGEKIRAIIKDTKEKLNNILKNINIPNMPTDAFGLDNTNPNAPNEFLQEVPFSTFQKGVGFLVNNMQGETRLHEPVKNAIQQAHKAIQDAIAEVHQKSDTIAPSEKTKQAESSEGNAMEDSEETETNKPHASGESDDNVNQRDSGASHGNKQAHGAKSSPGPSHAENVQTNAHPPEVRNSDEEKKKEDNKKIPAGQRLTKEQAVLYRESLKSENSVAKRVARGWNERSRYKWLEWIKARGPWAEHQADDIWTHIASTRLGKTLSWIADIAEPGSGHFLFIFGNKKEPPKHDSH